MTLRELIQHRQTTQAAVARSLGWKPQTLSAYVRGLRFPKYDTAIEIAKVLDASLTRTAIGWDYCPAELIPDADRENGE